MKKNKLTNLRRFADVKDLLDRLQCLSFENRIKQIYISYRDGLLNNAEFADLVELTVNDKENKKIKHGKKKDPKKLKQKIDDVICMYVFHDVFRGSGYNEATMDTAGKFNISRKLVEKYIADNRDIVNHLKKVNLDPIYKKTCQKKSKYESLRLGLNSKLYEKEFNSEIIPNMVKYLVEQETKQKTGYQIVAEAAAYGLRPVPESRKKA